MSLQYQRTVDSLKRMIADDQKAIEDTRGIISRVESKLHRIDGGQKRPGLAPVVDSFFPTFCSRVED